LRFRAFKTHHIFWQGMTSGLSLWPAPARTSGTVSSLLTGAVSEDDMPPLDMYVSNGFGRCTAGVSPVRIEPVRSFQSIGPAAPSSMTTGS
jgi:hypothetical protein